jgi:hypothetical protein
MSKSEWVEWDAFPDPPKRRRKPRIETVEILPPRQPERTARLDIHHHHRREGIGPQRLLIIVALVALAILVVRSPGALILISAIIPVIAWKVAAVVGAILFLLRL